MYYKIVYVPINEFDKLFYTSKPCKSAFTFDILFIAGDIKTMYFAQKYCILNRLLENLL